MKMLFGARKNSLPALWHWSVLTARLVKSSHRSRTVCARKPGWDMAVEGFINEVVGYIAAEVSDHQWWTLAAFLTRLACAVLCFLLILTLYSWSLLILKGFSPPWTEGIDDLLHIFMPAFILGLCSCLFRINNCRPFLQVRISEPLMAFTCCFGLSLLPHTLLLKLSAPNWGDPDYYWADWRQALPLP